RRRRRGRQCITRQRFNVDRFQRNIARFSFAANRRRLLRNRFRLSFPFRRRRLLLDRLVIHLDRQRLKLHVLFFGRLRGRDTAIAREIKQLLRLFRAALVRRQQRRNILLLWFRRRFLNRRDLHRLIRNRRRLFAERFE